MSVTVCTQEVRERSIRDIRRKWGILILVVFAQVFSLISVFLLAAFLFSNV